MTVHMGDKIKSLPPLLSGKSVSVLISRYADAFVDDVEDRECRLRTRTLASKEDRAVAAEEPWDDDRWRDEGDMFQPCGTFVQVRTSSALDWLGSRMTSLRSRRTMGAASRDSRACGDSSPSRTRTSMSLRTASLSTPIGRS
jgi:hypothetical protein